MSSHSSLPDLAGHQLVAWWERTAAGWHLLLAQHPALLTIACDIRETTSVGGLLQHVVGAELRYAERLHGLAETPYQAIPLDSVEAVYKVHDRAKALLHELDSRPDEFWQGRIEFTTRSAGVLSAPRRALYLHLMLHSIRHYAQLATLVRQHGVKPDWPMDYLFMEAY